MLARSLLAAMRIHQALSQKDSANYCLEGRGMNTLMATYCTANSACIFMLVRPITTKPDCAADFRVCTTSK